jgi:hypothetical protein
VAKTEIEINARRPMVSFLTMDIKVVMVDEVGDVADIPAN